MAIKLKKELKTSAAAIALASAFLLPSTAMAQEVTLASTDGTINVTGQFIAFENDTYVLRTALGDLRIAASSVICEGAACPTFETADADVVITGSDAIGLGMMPLLMTGFAEEQQRAHNLEALIDRVVSKPFSLKEICAAVDAATSRTAHQGRRAT